MALEPGANVEADGSESEGMYEAHGAETKRDAVAVRDEADENEDMYGQELPTAGISLVDVETAGIAMPETATAGIEMVAGGGHADDEDDDMYLNIEQPSSPAGKDVAVGSEQQGCAEPQKSGSNPETETVYI